MRARYLLLLVVPAVVLLALGALPSLLGGGGTHYVVATEVELADGEPPGENVTATIDAANLSNQRFPYTTAALNDGVSEPYEAGRFGVKEAFTHTPFDEFGEFAYWNANATADGVAWIDRNGTYYRVEITDDPDGGNRSERLVRNRVAN